MITANKMSSHNDDVLQEPHLAEEKAEMVELIRRLKDMDGELSLCDTVNVIANKITNRILQFRVGLGISPRAICMLDDLQWTKLPTVSDSAERQKASNQNWHWLAGQLAKMSSSIYDR